MATLEHEETGYASPRRPAIRLPKVRWTQILAISIFWFALNLHWSALGIIILPSQVFKMVGDAQKGEALAFVLVPGAFVSLFANPLFGMLSDKTRGRLAAWGRRRPYILAGTLVNAGGLIWMAAARDIPTLAIAYVLVQFSSNAAQAPFHALLPDIVPEGQRGVASGVMGFLQILGGIVGVIAAGMFIDASKPLSLYKQGLWLTYGIIIAVLVALMLITIISVRERMGISAQIAVQEAETHGHSYSPDRAPEPGDGYPQGSPPLQLPETEQTADIEVPAKQVVRRTWITRATALTIAGTLITGAVVWGVMTLWNALQIAGGQIS